ncbi:MULTISPECIES: DnaB-like helicase C-terminal domain-containing protein [unclassified Sporosarcina]|uniref:replicative DNA helicase n=1 Tax=unclassified Sporosarcina TaxID=2647733 RepID=UPI00203B582F|nr:MULTISPECIES: DnaB-like helicase C-terminal domain-containing protein [unclassified Sporosarcina]GKV65210.1 replicative DNA helicase [Sporosarcina sp. NCCP-2331]GLB55334.1 replicative DNA helicase [Sporosarcina sp. NCCP-2378]
MSSELAEKSVLGTMLQENHFILDSGIQAAYFQSRIHRIIFSAMHELAGANKVADYITLLIIREPASLGGANYLAELKNFGHPARFDEYKEIIVNKWREIEKARILQLAQHNNWSIAEIQQSFDSLQDDNTVSMETSLKNELIKQYERPFIPLDENIGTTTGLAALDRILNGFQDSEFIVVAARPSMGKTDTLNHFALHAGWAGHLPIIFSLEMNRKPMIDRLIAATAGYSRLRMRNPYKHFTDKQKGGWGTVMDRLNEAHIHVDDRSALRVSEMKARARKIMKESPDKHPIIFIDYLQIIRPDGNPGNQTQSIGQISADLKNMAKEFNCPVVVLSQLSRAVEQRQEKRPIMSDLRDSGNIEQDADVVVFLYRDDYYHKRSTPTDELDITKHRNGPTGRITVSYIKETGELSDIEQTKRVGSEA